jgi:hypothetical protein
MLNSAFGKYCFFHILLRYCLILKYIFFKSLINLHTMLHNDKVKTGLKKIQHIYKNTKTEISHLHKYSDTLLSTLLKHLWQRLQPQVFLGMMLQARSFSQSSLQILSSSVRLDWERRCTAIFRSLQSSLTGFKSGLWLGHSRTFRDLSRSHCCIVLAVCSGSLSFWKVNLHPSLRSLALWTRFS